MFSQWLRERSEHEEKQHGRALRRYVEAGWPEREWEKACQGFYAEYAPCCAVDKLGPTRALELASRCVVETGTAPFYDTLAKVSPEPILAELAVRIKDEENRHYNCSSTTTVVGRRAPRQGARAPARSHP